MSQAPKILREKTVIQEVIELYRDSPCLWNHKDKFYTSKYAREKAYNTILEKYKLIHEDANIHTIKKKIDNLRTSFKREYKKVLESNYRHEPSLWYFKHLTFLIDGYQVEPNPTEEYLSFDNEDEEEEEEDKDTLASPQEGTTSPERHVIMKVPIKEEYINPAKKRVKPTSVFLTEGHLDDEASSYTIEEKGDKANEAFGKTIGLHLYELDVMQKTIAEKLISEVIFYGRLGKLTTKTKMINLDDE